MADDTEAYLANTSDWWARPAVRAQQYLDWLDGVRARTAGLPLFAAIPFWYDVQPLASLSLRGERTPRALNTYVADTVDRLIERFAMQEAAHEPAGALSHGEQRRLEIAMCLAQDPRLLLLDEPTAGMARADTNNTIDLLKQISDERDITIAIIEHDMHVVFSLAQRITVLAQGTPLVEDTPDNIKGHPKVREAYLGESA